MINNKRKSFNIKALIFIFSICLVLRLIEYFIIRTDKTIIDENFIHKVLGILILGFCLKYYSLLWDKIGFKKESIIRGFFIGMFLGLFTYFFSYFVEILVLRMNNPSVWLEFFASGFSLTGTLNKNTEIFFIILPIIFNLINSVMEEGLFRGLFLKLCLKKHTFAISNIIQSTFFGLWHMVMPIRSYVDGEMSLSQCLIMSIGYIILSFIIGIKLGLLVKYTGALWSGFFFHTFNNTIVNLLHVVTPYEIDSMQIIRVVLAQLLSLLIVWLYGIYKKKTFKHNDNSNKYTISNSFKY